MRFVSWQHCGLPMGVAPYDRPSPCLALVVADLRARFAVLPGGGTGYNVRPIRGGELPSTHGYGAARDPKIPDDTQRQAAIDYLIAHHERSGVQAIHDYFGSRQWRANGRPGGVWIKVTPNRTTGWGQTWARYLHIEIHPDWWADTTPLDQRGPGYHPIDNPTPTPPKDEDDDMVTIYRVEGRNARFIGGPDGDTFTVCWTGNGDADPKVLPRLAALAELGAKEQTVKPSACLGWTFSRRGLTDASQILDGLYQWSAADFFEEID